MKINIDMAQDQQMALMTFYVDQFNSSRDYVVALSFVYSVAADFELGPEIETEDLEEFVKKFKEQGKTEFTFEISEDGLEINVD